MAWVNVSTDSFWTNSDGHLVYLGGNEWSLSQGFFYNSVLNSTIVDPFLSIQVTFDVGVDPGDYPFPEFIFYVETSNAQTVYSDTFTYNWDSGTVNDVIVLIEVPTFSEGETITLFGMSHNALSPGYTSFFTITDIQVLTNSSSNLWTAYVGTHEEVES